MSDYQKIASELTNSLELSQPPIAVSLCDSPPPGIPAFDGVVPAGCSFWQLAATRMFFTSTKDHELCLSASTPTISRSLRPRIRPSCKPRSRP